MRTILILASAALVSAATFAGPAAADDRLHLTPPLYREQAHETRQIRPMGEMTVTPQPVGASTIARKTLSAADRPMIQASAEARR